MTNESRSEETREIHALGHKFSFDDIENPHLRSAVRSRMGNFIFNYSDHSDNKGGHTDHDAYGDHSEYRERSDHEDHYRGSNTNHDFGFPKHTDYDDYDNVYQDYDDKW